MRECQETGTLPWSQRPGDEKRRRIPGLAAFHAGCIVAERIVQDSPLYGAERWGAPTIAFTRSAGGPIRERGSIPNPDLVVVVADSLLVEAAVHSLAGCTATGSLLINSTANDASALKLTGRAGLTYCADFTSLVPIITGSLASLRTALGGVA